jgi:hypothetical protein
MSDSGGPDPIGQDSTAEDSTAEDSTAEDSTAEDSTAEDASRLSEEQLDRVVGGSSIFDVGWPQCSTCGKKHDPSDWSACTR